MFLAVRLERLDCDDAAKAIVSSLVDDTHSTGSEESQDFIGADTIPGRERHALLRVRLARYRRLYTQSRREVAGRRGDL